MRGPNGTRLGADCLISTANFSDCQTQKNRSAPRCPSEGVKYCNRPQTTFFRKPRKRGGPINSMKKLCLVLIALACLPALAAGQVVEEIIARVNNQIITRSEFERSKDQLKEEAKQQDPKDPDKAYADREKDILRDLIDQQLLLDRGKDLNITGDTELIKELDKMRKEMKLDSMEALEKETTKQGILGKALKKKKR